MIKIIDFYATWCSPCKVMSPIVDEVATETKAEVEKVNVDQATDRARAANIMGIPTFVILKDGTEIARKTGIMTKAEFKKLIADV